MLKHGLLLSLLTSSCFALPYADSLKEQVTSIAVRDTSPPLTEVIRPPMVNIPSVPYLSIKGILAEVQRTYEPEKVIHIPLDQIKRLLQLSTLNEKVIDKVLTTLQCACHTEHNTIVTIIDYSLPSSKKRLWVFNLKEKKLLFNTYVSHGIKSGVAASSFFSNKYNSKASSIGVYTTEKAYYGRHGLSLKLDGLEQGFNDNAANRAVVMHGGWYVEEDFINKYGRAGRSWGCPALPDQLAASIINTIKNKALFVAYYPSDDWFKKSRFQNCRLASKEQPMSAGITPEAVNESREDVLFLDVNNNNRHEENEPIIALSAVNYRQIFESPIPLERMLRRQIQGMEYIALSNNELNRALSDDNKKTDLFNRIIFVVPKIVMEHGYYATEMQHVSLGKVKSISYSENATDKNEITRNYTIYFEQKSTIKLKSSNQFIRWVGL